MRIVYAFRFDGPKRAGTKFDSIGYLNLTRLLGQSRGSARSSYGRITTFDKKC